MTKPTDPHPFHPGNLWMKNRGTSLVMATSLLMGLPLSGGAQTPQPPAQVAPENDSIKTLVSRLELERYKATLKGLAQFGDRRQGTDRNRAAVDWIDARAPRSASSSHSFRL